MVFKFLNIFKTSNSEESSEGFNKITLEQIKRKLKLQSNAKINGLQNIPDSDDDLSDNIEVEIENLIDQELNDTNASFIKKCSIYSDRIRSKSLTSSIKELEGIKDTVLSAFKTIVHDAKDELYNAGKELEQSSRSLEKFKSQNNLDRPAKPQANMTFTFGLAFLMLVIETVANAQFFAQGNELGLLGGFFMALIPAVLNTVLAYFVGNFILRGLHYRKVIPKVIYLILFGLFSAIVVILNLSVAHYRDLTIESGAEFAPSQVINRVKEQAFNLSDINSWFLFSIGIIVVTIVSLKFFGTKDKYPGYTEKYEEYLDITDDYKDRKSSYVEHLAETRDESHKDLQMSIMRSENNMFEIEDISSNIQRYISEYKSHHKTIQNVGSLAMKYYYDQNSVHRDTRKPARFTKKWKSSISMVDDFDQISNEVKETLKKYKVSSNELKKKVVDCNNSISKAHDRSLRELQSIEDLATIAENA